MKCLEAFAGAGGAALGLRAAGFASIACLEWDKDAAGTLAAAGFPAVHGDVRAYTPTERPDLLWASPPCQAWSSAGKRGGATDERNGWPWTFDLVDRAKPTWAVFENVPGLLMHSGEANCDRAGSEPVKCPGCYWLAVILPEARRRFAVVEWRVLDAASFGVPQRRHRVFLVCGPTAIRWPEPTHADPDTLRQGSMFGPKLQPWRTVRQALGLGGFMESGSKCRRDGDGVPRGPLVVGTDRPSLSIDSRPPDLRVIGDGSNPRGKDAAHERTYRDLTDEPSTTVAAEQIGNAGPFVVYKRGCNGGVADEAHTVDEPACALRGAPGGSSQPFLVMREDPSRGWEPSGTDAPSPSGHSAPQHLVRARYAPGQGRAASEPERLDEPAPSVTGQEVKGTRASASSGFTFNGGPDRASDAAFLAAGIRRLTVLECATLQDFPPDHPWQGTQTSRYRQVGNAVPPKLAEVIARAVVIAAKP